MKTFSFLYVYVVSMKTHLFFGTVKTCINYIGDDLNMHLLFKRLFSRIASLVKINEVNEKQIWKNLTKTVQVLTV